MMTILRSYDDLTMDSWAYCGASLADYRGDFYNSVITLKIDPYATSSLVMTQAYVAHARVIAMGVSYSDLRPSLYPAAG